MSRPSKSAKVSVTKSGTPHSTKKSHPSKGVKASASKASRTVPKRDGNAGSENLPKTRKSHVSKDGAPEAELRDASDLAPFADLLLPYQIRYLRDRSPMKKLVKSRRIGGTWTQSLEDVLDCVDRPGLKVWFSSADKTAGLEYLDYVRMWVEVANLIVQTVVVAEDALGDGEGTLETLQVADTDEATATVVVFHNGSKITILSSNPSGFRSKGGKVVLDEFAHHGRDRDLWKAAQPVAGAWGYPIRILSTQNGKGCAFYKLGNPEFDRANLDDLDEDEGLGTSESDWSVHTVTIEEAVADGMYDRVKKRPTTHAERAGYLRRLRRQCLNEAQYQEEYMCRAQDEAHALLPYSLIESVERDNILGLNQVTGPLYLGMDVGRKRDLTVIYVLELCGMVLHARHLVVMEKARFQRQKDVLWLLLSHPKMVRASIDATGLGAGLGEDTLERFGSYMIDSVHVTEGIKDALATRMVREFEDSGVLIPVDPVQRESLHSVQRTVSITNKARYDAKRDDENGHGDHFWALAHAIAAARTGDTGPADARSLPLRAETTPFDPQPFGRGHLDSWAAME